MASDANVASPSNVWKLTTLTTLIVAAIAIVAAYMQYQKVTRLSAALDRVNQQSAQLQQQVAQLQQENAQQGADLRQQSNTIVAEAKPDLPLSVRFRRAILSAGLVMELRNNSASQLEVAAAFTSAATGLTERREIVLPPNRIMQLGAAQGWAFADGQRIEFRNVSYRPAQVVVP